MFSGDIGAAIVDLASLYKEVKDFETHLPYLEGFHKRYMAGNIFTKAWVAQVRKNPPLMIAPQHGAIFKGLHVSQFLDWFETIQCGGDLLENLYPKG